MKSLILILMLMIPHILFSQHAIDSSYHPPIPNPAYEIDQGPIILIDEAHLNFHTMGGRYQPFASLLERDGYRVLANKGKFNRKHLSKARILVISNALNENVEDWNIPNPSAFTKREIRVIRDWVAKGGHLFLIADHMPFGDASKDLAQEFGFEFTNGFVFDTLSESKGIAHFSLKDHSLEESIVTKGRDSSENVHEVVTFTGQAFRIPYDAQSILTFGPHFVNFLPDTAWVFDGQIKQISAEGWSQGAYNRFGKGKVVVFGEAAMFTAQLAGPEKRKGGMNSEIAQENHQLLLNIIHWLDGIIE